MYAVAIDRSAKKSLLTPHSSLRPQGGSYQDCVHTKNPGVFSARAQTRTQYPTIKTSPVQHKVLPHSVFQGTLFLGSICNCVLLACHWRISVVTAVTAVVTVVATINFYIVTVATDEAGFIKAF